MADEPLDALKGKTPLEYAQTPHMDEVARSGSVGQFYAIKRFTRLNKALKLIVTQLIW